MKQLAFYFDSSQCSGCKTCQVACKDKHNLDSDIKWRKVYEMGGGDWIKEGDAWVSQVRSYHVSMSCNHCIEPICMSHCPNKAIYKNDLGLVLIDENRCMGCRYCEWACPYGALQLDKKTGTITKCTLCNDYLEEGKLPACVSACPMRVLETGEFEVLKARYGKYESVFPLPPEHYTHPAIVLKPHQHAKQRTGLQIINKEEVKNA